MVMTFPQARLKILETKIRPAKSTISFFGVRRTQHFSELSLTPLPRNYDFSEGTGRQRGTHCQHIRASVGSNSQRPVKYVECTFAASKVERMNYVGADRQKRNMYLNISPKYVELLHKVNIYTLFF